MDIKKYTRVHPIAILFSITILAVSIVLIFLYFASGSISSFYIHFLQKGNLYLALLFACVFISLIVIALAKIQAKPVLKVTLLSDAKLKYKSIHSFFINYKQQSLLFVIVFLAVLLVLIYFTKINLGEFSKELGDKDKPFYIRNIALLLAAIGTAIFTWWKNALTQKTIEVSESTRQDELFAQAVGLLERKNDLTTRKAGVHILKDLAMTSPKHAQKCIDMLCSLNEFWMPKILTSYPNFFEHNPSFSRIKDPNSIILKNLQGQYLASVHPFFKNYMDDISLSQLVLATIPQILSHINKNIEFNSEYSLSHTYLCSIRLIGLDFHKFCANMDGVLLLNSDLLMANLSSAVLNSANIGSSRLDFANFNYAELSYANLSLSDLSYTQLNEVDLSNAKLNGTILCNANIVNSNLQRSDLTMADLSGCILKNSDFQLANLTNANLSNSDLTDADFTNAILTGADFTNTNLTNTKFNGNFPSPDGQPPK